MKIMVALPSKRNSGRNMLKNGLNTKINKNVITNKIKEIPTKFMLDELSLNKDKLSRNINENNKSKNNLSLSSIRNVSKVKKEEKTVNEPKKVEPNLKNIKAKHENFSNKISKKIFDEKSTNTTSIANRLSNNSTKNLSDNLSSIVSSPNIFNIGNKISTPSKETKKRLGIDKFKSMNALSDGEFFKEALVKLKENNKAKNSKIEDRKIKNRKLYNDRHYIKSSILDNSIIKKEINKKYISKNNYFKFSFLKAVFTCFVSLTIISYVTFKSSFCKTTLLNIATNISNNQNGGINKETFIKLYGLYNEKNYIVNMQETIVADNIETIEQKQVTQIDLIDKSVNVEDKTVFMNANDKVLATITQETSSLQRVDFSTMKILNYSSNRNIDFEGLIEKNITLTKNSDKILLYNTHTSESYINSEGYQFEYSGVMRSQEAKYNMLAIAKTLDENLRQKGINSHQDTTPHDYATYTSAYAKSRVTVQNALENIGGAGIIIDVHRDASADLSYRPVANVNGVQVCQLMFVVGVGSSSVKNPNWEDNLALALKMQLIADKIYPGLFRPMIIRNSVYNQDLNKYALLVEFGATGNTIEEVKLSTRCLANLINIVYKD